MNPTLPDKASSESSSTPSDVVNAHLNTASQMASNAKDQVMSAAGAAKDTVARQSQATVSDIQGLSASTHQAGNDLNAHPLTKYHSFLYDTLTWKFPRASAIALFLVVSTILTSQFVTFSRLIFRALWVSFALTATVESVTKLVTGKGIVSSMKPRQYYQVNKMTFDVLFIEIANVFNFLVLEFQRLVFAEKTSHTAVACVISFIAYKLVRYVPLWGLALAGTIMAFATPPIYLMNQEAIDHHIQHAQSLAAEQAAMARDVANQHIGVATDRAKAVTSEWGKKAGVELPWSPGKTVPTPAAAGPSTVVGGKTPGATGISSLAGLNVPQATPQKRVDPAAVPLPETPAPAPVAL